MEPWRITWRNGFAKVLSDRALEVLARGLRDDDPLLVQGMTTVSGNDANDTPQGADAVTYSGWISGDSGPTVGDCEDYFARVCFEADQKLGEAAACRFFLNEWDEAPRGRIVAELLDEVERELEQRHGQPTASGYR